MAAARALTIAATDFEGRRHLQGQGRSCRIGARELSGLGGRRDAHICHSSARRPQLGKRLADGSGCSIQAKGNGFTDHDRCCRHIVRELGQDDELSLLGRTHPTHIPLAGGVVDQLESSTMRLQPSSRTSASFTITTGSFSTRAISSRNRVLVTNHSLPAALVTLRLWSAAFSRR